MLYSLPSRAFAYTEKVKYELAASEIELDVKPSFCKLSSFFIASTLGTFLSVKELSRPLKNPSTLSIPIASSWLALLRLSTPARLLNGASRLRLDEELMVQLFGSARALFILPSSSMMSLPNRLLVALMSILLKYPLDATSLVEDVDELEICCFLTVVEAVAEEYWL